METRFEVILLHNGKERGIYRDGCGDGFMNSMLAVPKKGVTKLTVLYTPKVVMQRLMVRLLTDFGLEILENKKGSITFTHPNRRRLILGYRLSRFTRINQLLKRQYISDTTIVKMLKYYEKGIKLGFEPHQIYLGVLPNVFKHAFYTGICIPHYRVEARGIKQSFSRYLEKTDVIGKGRINFTLDLLSVSKTLEYRPYKGSRTILVPSEVKQFTSIKNINNKLLKTYEVIYGEKFVRQDSGTNN